MLSVCWATVGGMTLPVPVSIALDSAEELRRMLDQMDDDEHGERVWVAWQAEMLHHWAGCAVEEAPYFPALSAGLAEFAATVSARISTDP